MRYCPFKNIYKYANIKIFISYNDFIRYIGSFNAFMCIYFRFK